MVSSLKVTTSNKSQMSNLPATISTIPCNNFWCSQVLQPLSHRKIRKVINLSNASFMCVGTVRNKVLLPSAKWIPVALLYPCIVLRFDKIKCAHLHEEFMISIFKNSTNYYFFNFHLIELEK